MNHLGYGEMSHWTSRCLLIVVVALASNEIFCTLSAQQLKEKSEQT